MKRALILLSFFSICSAKVLYIETSLENRFSRKFYDKYTTILQGPNICFNTLYNGNIMAGLGLGPLLMNGSVPSNDSLGALIDMTFDLWANCYYVVNFKFANTLMCFGGKIGKIADSYTLVYDINEELVDEIKDYSVRDTYFSSVGLKILSGFKHFRIVLNGFMNFGQRKESINTQTNYEFHGEKKSFIVSPQFDIGIAVLFGKFW